MHLKQLLGEELKQPVFSPQAVVDPWEFPKKRKEFAQP